MSAGHAIGAWPCGRVVSARDLSGAWQAGLPKRVTRDSGWVDIRFRKSLSPPSRVVFPVPMDSGRWNRTKAALDRGRAVFKGEHVRTVYRKGAARHLLRTV